jgi:signal peptidase I
MAAIARPGDGSEISPRASVASRARWGHVVRVARFGAGTVAMFIVVVGACAVALAVLPGIGGRFDTIVISSGSMRPSARPGDVLLVAPSSSKRLSPGELVVFRDRTKPGLVTHRVVGVDQRGSYLTKGDANATVDSTPVEPGQVVGSGVLLVPFIGVPRVWLADGEWLRLAGLGVAFALAVWASRFAIRAEYDPWAVDDAVAVAP